MFHISICNDCTVEITEVKFNILPHQASLPKSPVEIENGLIQETSYTIHELISFLSITLGRQFGRSADMIFNKCNIDNKIAFSTKSIPILNQISINDLKYVDLNLFFVGVIQGSRVVRATLKDLTQVGIIFSQGRIFEPLCQFLMNANLMKKTLDIYRSKELNTPI